MPPRCIFGYYAITAKLRHMKKYKLMLASRSTCAADEGWGEGGGSYFANIDEFVFRQRTRKTYCFIFRDGYIP